MTPAPLRFVCLMCLLLVVPACRRAAEPARSVGSSGASASSTPAAAGASAQASSQSVATPAGAVPANAVPAGGLRRAPACTFITRAEMAELLGGPIGKPSGDDSDRKTSCTYPPADASSYAQAEITIDWDHGTATSFAGQLSRAFSGSGVGRQVAHDVDLGDEASYAMEGLLSIRTGKTLVTISVPMRPDAETHAIAVGKKLMTALGAPVAAAAATKANDTASSTPAPAKSDEVSSLFQAVGRMIKDAAAPEPEVVIRRPVTPIEPGEPVFPEGLAASAECPVPEAAPAATQAVVPLRKGLTLSHFWKPHSEDGLEQYECLLQVTDVTSSYADITYTCDGRPTVAHRRQCLTDLRSAHVYMTEAGTDVPLILTGTTMFSLSSEALRELKETRNTKHRYIEMRDGWTGLKKPLLLDLNGNLHSGRFDRETRQVIVNDRMVEFPVLTGFAFPDGQRQTQVAILDDEGLPLMLDYEQSAIGFRIRYTKISYPGGELEKQLATDKHVDVYGIYFNFASDVLRPESAPVLSEIAEVLRKNADWQLTINGHTDNIGGDAANLALSRRRSESVRRALVEQYHIDSSRLVTAGFGASQPKAPNDTTEGRAKNRRVELVRR